MTQSEWPIIGQAQAISYFEQLLAYERRQAGRIGGNFILSGPKGAGKKALLYEFLRRLLGVEASALDSSFSTDIVELARLPEKREIGVAQARTFSAQLSLSALAGPYRIGIIHEAELLSLEAANALLKALEDARERVLVFFLTTAADALPSTVCSRSQTISFAPVSADAMYDWLITTHGLTRPLAKSLARLSEGKPGLAAALATDKKALEQRLAPARVFCAALTSTLAERWQSSAKLLGTLKGAEAVERTCEVLDAWRLTVRDLLLMRLNQPELTVHAVLDQELKAVLPRLSITELRALEKRIDQAGSYLSSNVSPKLVLEQVLMAF